MTFTINKVFFVANFLLSRNSFLALVSKILNFKNFIMDWFLNLILVLLTNLELGIDLRNYQSLFLWPTFLFRTTFFQAFQAKMNLTVKRKLPPIEVFRNLICLLDSNYTFLFLFWVKRKKIFIGDSSKLLVTRLGLECTQCTNVDFTLCLYGLWSFQTGDIDIFW